MESRAVAARERSSVYAMLAEFFRMEPDGTLVSALRDPSVHRNLADGGLLVDRDELLLPAEEDVGASLRGDFRALFVAPATRILLNESVNRSEEGTLMGRSTMRVERFIESVGLTIHSSSLELPDHLSVELEVMEKLTAAEAHAWESGAAAAAEKCRSSQEFFLAEHVAVWVPRVCQHISQRAATGFYRAVADATRIMVDSDLRRLREARDSSLFHQHDLP